MSAAAAASALQAKVGGGPYACKREENTDHTIDLEDVDYLCVPRDRRESGYWIGTDAHHITDLEPTG